MKNSTCTTFLLLLLITTVFLLACVDVSSVHAAREITDDSSFSAMPWFGGKDYFPGWEVPSGGDGWKKFMHPSMVCREKGACFNKKLTCPAKCFRSKKSKGDERASSGGCSFDCIKCKVSC